MPCQIRTRPVSGTIAVPTVTKNDAQVRCHASSTRAHVCVRVYVYMYIYIYVYIYIYMYVYTYITYIQTTYNIHTVCVYNLVNASFLLEYFLSPYVRHKNMSILIVFDPDKFLVRCTYIHV
jgi:hypothetical protein